MPPYLCFCVAQPQITTHPLNKLIEVNNDSTNVQFTCMAEGASSYNWERKDDDIPTDALGINSSTLSLTTLKPPDEGQYRCVAVNQHGSTSSNYAVLTVKGNSCCLNKYFAHKYMNVHSLRCEPLKIDFIFSTQSCD